MGCPKPIESLQVWFSQKVSLYVAVLDFSLNVLGVYNHFQCQIKHWNGCMCLYLHMVMFFAFTFYFELLILHL